MSGDRDGALPPTEIPVQQDTQQSGSSDKRNAALLLVPDAGERAALRTILESEGVEVREASSPAQAIDALDDRLRLALLAAEAGAAGVSLCEQLRDASRRSHFAIAVIADPGAAAALEAFERAGAGDFLARPLDSALFRHRVRCLLRGARHLRDLSLVEARLEDAERLGGVGLWELDPVADRFACSASARRILGLDPAREQPGRAELCAAVHPEDREAFAAALDATLGGRAPLAVVHRLASGGESRVETRGGLLPGDEGGPSLLRGASLLHEAGAELWSGTSGPIPSADAGPEGRSALETRLRGAIERGDLALYYQPKAHADSRRITSLEALIRWTDAELGVVSPADFIPVAESCELIVPIGLWVLRTACRQVVAWREAGLELGRVAVNVSPRQFHAPGFIDSVLAEIEESGADPGSLELEITEGCLVEGDDTVPTLETLREHGLGIAIDDFGTGYSSLQYLRRLPIDVLKIDRAFIRDLEADPAARSLVASIISLAWSLGLRVVAEGVETEAQWSFLRDHGCDEIQGFAVSCALPASECEAFVRSRGTERD